VRLLLATALLLPLAAWAVPTELVCTSTLTRKAAVDSMTRRLQLLDNSCARSRSGGSELGAEFCDWAEEARRELTRCRVASVPWATSVAIRFDPDKGRDEAAQMRHTTCYTYPEADTVDTAVAVTTPASVTVTATRAKRLHERYARQYQPLVIDRKAMTAGYGAAAEFRCSLATAGPAGRPR
jgi:hypothetical protein